MFLKNGMEVKRSKIFMGECAIGDPSQSKWSYMGRGRPLQMTYISIRIFKATDTLNGDLRKQHMNLKDVMGHRRKMKGNN